MAGFLLMAMAIPGVFTDTDDAVVFGLAYLVVNVVPRSCSRRQGTRRLMPSGALHRSTSAAPAGADRGIRAPTTGAGPSTSPPSSSSCRVRSSAGCRAGRSSATHFVERHGLVIIVALGESVVAIGAGAAELELDLGLAATAVLALGLSAAMWWVYFDRDDEAAAVAMAAAEGDERSQLGLSVAYVHAVMIAGIIVASAGIKCDPVPPHGSGNHRGGVEPRRWSRSVPSRRGRVSSQPRPRSRIQTGAHRSLVVADRSVGLGSAVSPSWQRCARLAFTLLAALLVSESLGARYPRDRHARVR